MPNRLPLLASLAILALASCSHSGALARGPRFQFNKADQIARDRTVPGKGTPEECMSYAQALHQKFKARGIPSKVLVYDYEWAHPSQAPLSLTSYWKSPLQTQTHGRHAVVLYESAGRLYVTDNQRWRPKWVAGGSPETIAQDFSGPYYAVGNTEVVAQ